MEPERKNIIYKTISVNGQNKRQCLSCERLFIHKQDVLKHATMHSACTNVNQTESCTYKEVTIEGKKKYECQICCRHFIQKRNVTLHLNRDHMTEMNKTVDKTIEGPKNHDSEELHAPAEADIIHSETNSDMDAQLCVDEISSDTSSADINSDLESSNYNEFDILDQNSDLISSNYSDTDGTMSDQNSDFESQSVSGISSVSSLESSSDIELENTMSDQSSHEATEFSTESKRQFSQSEIQALKILSCFQKHNLTASACKDIMNTMKHMFPDSERVNMLDMDYIYSTVGDPDVKEVHYCEICGNIFSENTDEFRCTSLNCNGLRYKGSLCNQKRHDRQPRKSFVIADIQTQLTTLLQTPGILEDIRKCKSEINMRKTDTVITDITDGSEYRRLLTSENGFLTSSPYNLTAILNADGINLYSSSKVELWPFFIAINELSPPLRFSRDNLLLVAIWQGKGKPPFERLLEHLGRELELLYNEGVKVPIQNNVIIAKMAVVCGVFDLPAKASILNMTYFNGAESCISCEDPGIVVKQGKGHTRCYPFRESGQEFKERVHDEVVEHMRSGTDKKRIKGFKGTSGLLAIHSYDLVQGTVPDYMHGILLGVTNTLLSKWFSPSQSGQPYFIGKHIQTVSKRLHNIKPPLSVERLPRNLEKHFASLKATELQMWLLFYSGPCLTRILPENYLKHFGSLSEAVYILLGDHVSVDQIGRATSLLREFYSDFGKLYGQGSCGLNVHNACVHLISYVQMWGPIWAWSCFPFEDANAALLQSAHGTGNVTKQVLKYKHMKSAVRAIDSKSSSDDSTLWKVKKKSDNCDICGKLQPFLRDNASEQVLSALPECLANQSADLRLVDRIRRDGKQFCSKKYSRLQRRISYIVLYNNSDKCLVGSVQYFIYNLTSNLVYAVVQKFISDTDQEVQTGKHLLKVKATNLIQIVLADQLIDTLVYVNASLSSPPEEEFVALMPSSHGHAILK